MQERTKRSNTRKRRKDREYRIDVQCSCPLEKSPHVRKRQKERVAGHYVPFCEWKTGFLGEDPLEREKKGQRGPGERGGEARVWARALYFWSRGLKSSINACRPGQLETGTTDEEYGKNAGMARKGASALNIS